MKKLISKYTFDPIAKTITFNDYTSIDLERVLLITNTTNNTIIYNFADSTKGGTVSGNVLTLTFDTTTMNATDRLQIFYDDTDLVAIEGGNINNLLQLFKMLIQSPIGRLAIDSSGRLKMVIDLAGVATPVTQSGTWSVTENGIWMMPTYSNDNIQFQLSFIEYNECQRSKFTFV